MAKRGGRRRYLKGRLDEDMTFAALASKTLVAQIIGDNVDERTLISSIKASYSMSDLTPGADIGPILFGVAHSDYSAAEIEAYIENSGSWAEGDLTQQEVANRKIRIIGQLQSITATEQTVFNDGKPVTTKLNWILVQGATLDIWVYNLGGAPVATTTPNIQMQGHANLWPQ